jgi:dienelactone hydrolase
MNIRFFVLPHAIGPARETRARCLGQQIAVRIEGLTPRTRYTVRATRIFQGATFASSLVADADDDGVIATESAQPLGGTYREPDPDGLFWSMRATSDVVDNVSDAVIGFFVEHDGVVVGDARLAIHGVAPGVRVETVGAEHGLVATLYLPASASEIPGHRVPALIVLGGSEGGSEAAMRTAAALAHEGFAALAVSYFGVAGLPATLVEIPLEYFERALRFLERHDAVLPGRIGVLGRSRGGELALLLGAMFPELAAVVALVPSPYRWCSFAGPAAAAWTHRGVALPYLATLGPLQITLTVDPPRKTFASTPAFERALDSASVQSLAAALSPIEQITGPILLASGEDDQVWPATRMARDAVAHLAKHVGRDRTRDECLVYPSAGHTATAIPGEPTTDSASVVGGMRFARGGTPEGNARAQRDAWSRMLGFCRRHLAS